MAKIKYSALVSDMRNKLNGSVLSRNRYGSYIRNKVTPVNPQTVHQQRSRAIFSAASSAWAGLSVNQRKGFSQLAEEHTYTDIFGDQKALDGKAMFVKLNSVRQWVNKTILETAPEFTDLGVVEFAVQTAEEEDGELTSLKLAGQYTGGMANPALMVYMTPALPPEINFVKNRLRFVASIPANSLNSELAGLYTARFGSSVKSGHRVHIRIAVVNEDTGQQGIPTSTVGTVVEAD